ncbi:hypothetical protein GJ496_001485 [Pomphorhynchus laevis]|nr:hypothetical protein GJ496_001485 [Pomphorhynchus laevis]
MESNADFGNRYLSDRKKIFDHNAWDNVDMSEDAMKIAQVKLSQFGEASMRCERSIKDPKSCWNRFYERHGVGFFKDRDWLCREFTEIFDECNKDLCILDVGCGVGNCALPILNSVGHRIHKYYAFDCSTVAIEQLKRRAESEELVHENKLHAFCFDLDNDQFPDDFPLFDFVIIVFTLSSVKDPLRCMSKLMRLLKPDGLILFRDYLHLDMAHLRFKPDQCIKGDNVFIRGDGTIARFFRISDLEDIFGKECGLHKETLKVERRLQTNRAKKIEMYRRLVIAKYRNVCKINAVVP